MKRRRDPTARRPTHGHPAREAWGFILRFLAIWVLALLACSQMPDVERRAVDFTIANLVQTLRVTAVDVSVSGRTIDSRNASMRIVPDCTPLMPTLVLWAAMVAFPAPWRRKALGLVLGAAAVWLFNLVRVLILFGVLWWDPRHFHFVHVYLWQTGTVLVVLALFVLWVRLPARASGPA
jgi:exosortase H (IPTLxxWG-CTERM-specific)